MAEVKPAAKKISKTMAETLEMKAMPVVSAVPESITPMATIVVAPTVAKPIAQVAPVHVVPPRYAPPTRVVPSQSTNIHANVYNNGFSGAVDGRVLPDAGMPTEIITGALDITPDGHGIIRPRFSSSDFDAYLSNSQIRRFRLRPGDMISGPAAAMKDAGSHPSTCLPLVR